MAGLALLVLLAVTAPGAHAGTKEDLDAAKARLEELAGRVDAAEILLADRQAQLDEAAGELSDLAAKIHVAEDRWDELQMQIMDTRADLEEARGRYEDMRSSLDLRARAAYQQGPAGNLDFLLGSSSLAELSDRAEFMGTIARSDSELAVVVQQRATELRLEEARLGRLMSEEGVLLTGMAADQDRLEAIFRTQDMLYNEQRAILDGLAADRNEMESIVAGLEDKVRREELAAARAEVAEARALARQQARSLARLSAATGIAPVGVTFTPSGNGPFYACPVAGPHAYSDSFGAPRYGGGYHPHAGNDIFADQGTPIVAPFDGTVEKIPNSLGGLAIHLTGAEGYIYGAHLSAYGAVGEVTTGTVIGYVGDSGNAVGTPYHLHFEWHPNVIPSRPYRSIYGYSVVDDAVDPFPYLNESC